MSELSSALFGPSGIRLEFLRLLGGGAARLYIDTLDALEKAAAPRAGALQREEALAIIEEAVERHESLPPDDDEVVLATARERARAVFDRLLTSGWLEEEQQSDYQKLVFFEPRGVFLLDALRRIAFPGNAVFSDNLVNVCATLLNRAALEADPWAQIESCVGGAQLGISELRLLQKSIERLTKQQLASVTLRENLSIVFDAFARQIGRGAYTQLVEARLHTRLAEARREVERLQLDAGMLGRMQAEVQRRDQLLSPETAMSHVRLRLEELAELLDEIVPLANQIDRRTSEFSRRSLARFRYLQEVTSENRGRVQKFFETLNSRFCGRRFAEIEQACADLPPLFVHEMRLPAGLESLHTPRLRREAGEIEPLSDPTEAQQERAINQVGAAMRDSLTVSRANAFVENLPWEDRTVFRSDELPIRCDEDIADVISCLLHAHAGDARFRVLVPRERNNADAGEQDRKLNYRIERFMLTKK